MLHCVGQATSLTTRVLNAYSLNGQPLGLWLLVRDKVEGSGRSSAGTPLSSVIPHMKPRCPWPVRNFCTGLRSSLFIAHIHLWLTHSLSLGSLSLARLWYPPPLKSQCTAPISKDILNLANRCNRIRQWPPTTRSTRHYDSPIIPSSNNRTAIWHHTPFLPNSTSLRLQRLADTACKSSNRLLLPLLPPLPTPIRSLPQ